MFIKFNLFFVFVFCFVSGAIAQHGEGPTGKMTGLTSLYDIGKAGYDIVNVNSQITDSTVMPVMIIRLKSNIVNTTPFTHKYPNHKIPMDVFKITFPNLENTTDTIGILWFLRESVYSKLGIVNVMLITLSVDSVYNFYFDYNNNRDFTDDGDPYVFQSYTKQKNIVIEDNRKFYSFTLQNPFIEVEDIKRNRARNIIIRDSIWRATDKKFTANLTILVSSGSGRPEMSYVPLEAGDTSMICYKAHVYSSAAFSLVLELNWFNFTIGINGSIEKEDIGERFEHIYIYNYYIEDYIERIRSSTGHWPDAKFNFGLSLGYNIRLFKVARIMPYFGISSCIYLVDEPFLKYKNSNSVRECFKERYSIFYGSRVKFLVGEKTAFVLDIYQKNSYFDASSYFGNIDPSTFKMKYNKFYFGAGIQYRF
ncbi:MAG: hypothetical protein IMY69_09455 [Bacteroidetes bacterium]|nr:hypothetical protein [Bacteroidota bacterium]MCK4288022.1 hypothetical protein [Bacteroidales bacterium]MCK4407205.1 hypothetical protein [Bacteroidales bacterium]